MAKTPENNKPWQEVAFKIGVPTSIMLAFVAGYFSLNRDNDSNQPEPISHPTLDFITPTATPTEAGMTALGNELIITTTTTDTTQTPQAPEIQIQEPITPASSEPVE